MFKTIRLKETRQIALVTGSKRNKRGYSERYQTEASRHFRNKKREYLKDKINEFETNSKYKNIRNLYRGIN
jgi:hypothetical protein